MRSAQKREVFVVTQRDEDGTMWLMHGELDCITTMWSGPFDARTFETEKLAAYVAARITRKPKRPDYEVGPAKVAKRYMKYGFKDWIRRHG